MEAERALANTLQNHAASLGLAEWAGQVIGAAPGEGWFGGIELSPAHNTTIFASMEVEQMESGQQLVVVRFVAVHMRCNVNIVLAVLR